MPIQMSAYLKTVLRNLVFNKRKGKAGIRRKATQPGSNKPKDNNARDQRGEKGHS